MARQKKPAAAKRHQASDPLAPLRQMTSQLDRAFDEAARWPSTTQGGTTWAPRVEVFEKGNCLIARVDLPGVKKADVTVELTDGHLLLSGERRDERQTGSGHVYQSEREYGSFRRTIPVPGRVEAEGVTATFADGVLEVSMPLQAARNATLRRIEVRGTVKRGTSR